MKRMKRAFAMVLCIAMVLSLCMVYAGAEDVYRYNTLDEIPENHDIFRAIRIGDITARSIDGNWYYQFREKGGYTVQIKASAFMTAPTNRYLVEDNDRLSKNCEGTSKRKCYYCDFSAHQNLYIVSMYRLELEANAKLASGIDVTATLTSGVTFYYRSEYCYKSTFNTSYWKSPETAKEYLAVLKRQDAEPLRPSVSVSLVNKNSQDVCLSYYQFTGWKGVYSEIDGYKYLSLALDKAGCALNVIAAIADPTKISIATAALSCAVAANNALSYDKQSSGESKRHNAIPGWEYSAKVTPPVMLKYSGNLVETHFEFSSDFDKEKTDFLVCFEFASEPNLLNAPPALILKA